MDSNFWHQRWAAREIGFHQDEVNPYLIAHFTRLNMNAGGRILVPLCGKSLDIVWLLKQGINVLGIELSELAVTEFFAEQQLSMDVQQHGQFTIFSAQNLRFICGDYFNLSAAHLGDIDAVYDRAALIALPAAMRRRYVQQLQNIAPNLSALLLITLQYEDQAMDGPPFSVSEQEVIELYSGDCLMNNCKIQWLDKKNIIADNLRFQQQGLKFLHEHAYLIKKEV